MRIYIANPEVANAIEGERSTVIRLRDESGQMVEMVFTSETGLNLFCRDWKTAVYETQDRPGELITVNKAESETRVPDALHQAGLLLSPFHPPAFVTVTPTAQGKKGNRLRQPRKPLPPRHP